MKHFLILLYLFTLAACTPPSATPQNPTPTSSMAIHTLAAATINAKLTEPAPAVDPNLQQLPTSPSSPTQNPSCTVEDGSWGAMVNGNTISIIFTVADCKITAVFFQGTIEGQWLIFSNSDASHPVNGSQFDFQYSFTDQDQYHLSGTFTSPGTASIQMVIFKGFRITLDQPSPFTEDLVIEGTAYPNS